MESCLTISILLNCACLCINTTQKHPQNPLILNDVYDSGWILIVDDTKFYSQNVLAFFYCYLKTLSLQVLVELTNGVSRKYIKEYK